MLMAIISTWLVMMTTEEIVKASFDYRLSLLSMLLSLSVLLFIIFPFIYNEIRNYLLFSPMWAIIKRTVIILCVSLIYSVVIGVLAIGFFNKVMLVRSGYLYNFVLENMEDNSEFALPLEMKAIGIGLSSPEEYLFENVDTTTVWENIKNVNTHAIMWEGISHANKIKFAYFISKFFDTKKLPRANYYRYLRLISKPDLEKAYDYLTECSYSTEKKLKLMYEIKPIGLKIIPGMLLYRTIFAMFVAIFLQLISEAKSITEPL